MRDVLALNRAYGCAASAGAAGSTARRCGRAPAGCWGTGPRRLDGRRAARLRHRLPDGRQAARLQAERRLAHSALGPPTPPLRRHEDQDWSTYEPVELPNPDRDWRCWPIRRGGRTWAVRTGASPAPQHRARRSDVRNRGRGRACAALSGLPPRLRHLHRAAPRGRSRGRATARGGGRAAGAHRAGSGGHGNTQPLLPDCAEPLALIVLTTHEGHFLGRARSHLLVWRDEKGRGSGTSRLGSLPPRLAAAYRARGARRSSSSGAVATGPQHAGSAGVVTAEPAT